MKAAIVKSLPSGFKPTANETEANGEKSSIEPQDLVIYAKGRNGFAKNKKAKWSFRRKMLQSKCDMTVSRSCRYRLSVPVMFWTTAFVLLLARGVNCLRDDHTRFSRSPKYDQGVDAQGRFITPSIQETYNVMQFLRELIQMQQQRAKEQSQVDGNGEDLNGSQIDWRRIPPPILFQMRAILNEQGSKEDKRGSYMSLCHFKICNLGKKGFFPAS